MLADLGGIEILHVGEIAVVDDAGLEPAGLELAFATGFGEVAHGHEVMGAADAGPVLVGSGHEEQVGDVDVAHKRGGLLVDFLEFLDALGRQGLVTGHAAGHEELRMRVFAAEDGHAAGSLDLDAQGFQVMGRGDEVGFGLKIVGRMTAEEVGVGEGTKLAAGHERLQFVLYGAQILGLRRAGGNGVGEGGGLRGIGLQGARYVNPVKGVQVIEVHNVVVQEELAEDQVADIGRVGRDVLVGGVENGVFQGAGGSEGVRVSADAAGTLGEVLSIAGIASLEDHFKAAEKRAAAADVFHFALFNFNLDAEVTFNTGQRINNDRSAVGAHRCSLTHKGPP